MSPSFPHEKLSDFLGHVVDIAGRKARRHRGSAAQHPSAVDRVQPSRHGDGTRLRVLSRRAGQGLSCRCHRRGGGSRHLHRTHGARPGGRGRNHERGRKQDRTLRGDGGSGAVAAARRQEVVGIPGGVPRPASRNRAAPARRLGGPRRVHAGRRARRGGRSAGWRDPRRSDEGGGTRCAAPPGRHGAGPRGGSGVLRGPDCFGSHSGGARHFGKAEAIGAPVRWERRGRMWHGVYCWSRTQRDESPR